MFKQITNCLQLQPLYVGGGCVGVRRCVKMFFVHRFLLPLSFCSATMIVEHGLDDCLLMVG